MKFLPESDLKVSTRKIEISYKRPIKTTFFLVGYQNGFKKPYLSWIIILLLLYLSPDLSQNYVSKKSFKILHVLKIFSKGLDELKPFIDGNRSSISTSFIDDS